MTHELYIKTKSISNGPGYSNHLIVSVFQRKGFLSKRIGSYLRNHGAMYHTFQPFKQGNDWFALYSTDYTATRVMTLPDCRDIGGEEPHTHGFCPVDYYIPYEHERVITSNQSGNFGFVAGCVWGDDSSWKIQYLDLSKIREGIVLRQELFGYLPMANSVGRLKDCISLDGYYPPETPIISLTTDVPFNLATGQRCEPDDV